MRKRCVKKQIIENQALERFLYAFTLMRKDQSQTHPTHPLARFLQAKMRFFYIFTYNRNKRNKINKILENQGFEALRKALRKALRMLYANLHFCKKHTIITPLPTPPLA